MRKNISNDKILLMKSDMLSSDNEFYYFIFLLEKNIVIGNCTFTLDNGVDENYYGNIGMEIKKDYRGKGYASLANELLIEMALEDNISNIKITVLEDNYSSIKSIEKINGIKFTGIVQIPSDCKLYREAKTVRLYELNLQNGKKER